MKFNVQPLCNAGDMRAQIGKGYAASVFLNFIKVDTVLRAW